MHMFIKEINLIFFILESRLLLVILILIFITKWGSQKVLPSYFYPLTFFVYGNTTTLVKFLNIVIRILLVMTVSLDGW